MRKLYDRVGYWKECSIALLCLYQGYSHCCCKAHYNIFGKEREMTDEQLMRAAVREAKKAEAIGEVPIGCVIAREGKVYARGYNRRMTDRSALAHAEIAAIRKACRKFGDWRLEDCTLYVTLEPCPMCAGAIVQARIPRVVFACRNPKAGSAGSVVDLMHVEGFNHQVEVEEGLLGEECAELMRSFFRALREARKKAVRD